MEGSSGTRRSRRQEDEERKKDQAERRRKLLDDVPLSLKRKHEIDEGQGEMKMPRTMFQQLEVMVSDQDLKGKLKRKIAKAEEGKKLHNQWIPREEEEK